ncbi:nucleotidyl transferase AbiEii/AbiGii toxin family protein [Sphaerotilus sp.]|uniref:nucleotidyl transferase AbiEii/AbiGii toxin family protein n=1 Tax=Sphaerotilus sp. TaxID=2093942 RepID=UPI002ACEABC9|nr:nucleotidyl transferase AbiEii/AbiGii toxin family protein [Sphaerotilus sp.]MDZ7858874.1 nucleotidyl transferase AbiEii/AbiGii toxin family protein [Sphaerotilus sp.]
MRKLSPDRLDLIEALLAETDTGGITAALLEKDEHLTEALRAVFSLRFEHATLVFCGGTSLSKAHGLIERMSEDADIKVVLADSTAGWPKTRLRRYLGNEVRHRILETLVSTGLSEDEAQRRSLNDNRYVHSQWAYERAYGGVTALRPNLQFELVVRRPLLPTIVKNIGALTDRLAQRTGAACPIPVIAVAETLAEKVLSFLRRFALHRAGRMPQAWDTALVRHVYDVHCIVSQAPGVVEDGVSAFAELMRGDIDEFGYQHPAFAADPRAVLRQALDTVRADTQTRKEYDEVLLPLVYGRAKHRFDEAWASFDCVARRMLSES